MVRVRERGLVLYISITTISNVRVADCCIQTAGKSDKMQINHVIKTDQWRSAPLRILSCPYLVLVCAVGLMQQNISFSVSTEYRSLQTDFQKSVFFLPLPFMSVIRIILQKLSVGLFA